MDRPHPLPQDDDDSLDLSQSRVTNGSYQPFSPISARVQVQFGACTHPGLRRTTSDDHYAIVSFGRSQDVIRTSLPDNTLQQQFVENGFGVIVADGMGSDGPELASRLALTTLNHLLLHYGKWNIRVNERTAWDIVQRAERYYRKIDEVVTEASLRHPQLAGASTTLTAAYSAGDELFVAHVGHSRAYLYRNGLLTRLTRDQTLAQRWIDTGRLVPTELAAQDLRHILTDAIGGLGGEPDVEIQNYLLTNKDIVLLCTNGLTDVVEDERIANVLGQKDSLDAKAERLINLALERGGPDNITAVLAKYEIP